MFIKKEEQLEGRLKEWRGGVYLCTVYDSREADILESKLRGEGIPSIRRYEELGNIVEIVAGFNTWSSMELYVPADKLEDARNIIVPVDLDDCEETE